MIRAPAMHAMSNPARHGLTIVAMYFGVARPKRDQGIVCHGETVQDETGAIFLFVGVTEDRKPILARHAVEFEARAGSLHRSRNRHGGSA